ncbi:MAG: hydroxymethylglutaryl-CoA lyase [Planctomycetes bacterium]|nr:hydroxymethylglutaryl-CoA lyase [Planctomycetota bacterium]
MNLPTSIEITEVGPRDGLQNQSSVIPTDTKIAYVDALSKTGLQRIEVSSFVNPKWVPQLADADAVFSGIVRFENVKYTALVPNKRGLDRAMDVGVDEIGLMTSASESFSSHNVNATIADSIERMKPLVESAIASGVGVRGYVSCIVACPYEGEIDAGQVRNIVEQLLDIGVEDISLGETIGVVVPTDIARIYDALDGVLSPEQSVLHLHDTRGTALACVLFAMQLGVRRFDASSGGLGGCPYAPGAAGNLATEDLVYFAERMGIDTGVDLEQLVSATRIIEASVGSSLCGRTYSASSCQDPSS